MAVGSNATVVVDVAAATVVEGAEEVVDGTEPDAAGSGSLCEQAAAISTIETNRETLLMGRVTPAPALPFPAATTEARSWKDSGNLPSHPGRRRSMNHRREQTMKRLGGLITLGVAVMLVAAACGDAEPAADAAPTTVASTPPSESLPPNPAAGACLEGDPNCNDIPGLEPEPPILPDEPDLGADPGEGTSGMVIGGGLTIAEALGTDSTGVIAVQGFVISDANGMRLCEALAESYPPQCGGASIEIANLDAVDPDDLTTAQGVTWTDYSVTILGEIIDGVLTPTPFST
jgi:hypothetical protein